MSTPEQEPEGDTGWVYAHVWDAGELLAMPGFPDWSDARACAAAENMGAEIVGPMEVVPGDQLGRDVVRWPIRRVKP